MVEQPIIQKQFTGYKEMHIADQSVEEYMAATSIGRIGRFYSPFPPIIML